MKWFTLQGWTPSPFQIEAWTAASEGASGLVHAPTGTGKTLAVALGPMLRELHGQSARWRATPQSGLSLVWLTPLKALAADTALALRQAAQGLGLGWKIELRTGDSTQSARARHRTGNLPHVLVTTPESLSLLLSYPELTEASAEGGAPLSHVRTVVVDEWHELLGSKRGVQVELALSRLRALNPRLMTWGLSATLGNPRQAAEVLTGPGASPRLITAPSTRRFSVATIIPDDIERFPWAGHLGIRLLPRVCEAIDAAGSTLLFTNTRSQAEIWFQQLLLHRPDYMGAVGLHHGSLDKQIRSKVEQGVKSGRLRCVVCTSSLDLGVDFAPVDQVVQIGSPKGLARFIQRAGRSGHQPGGVSRVVCVPTNALELIEFSAVTRALQEPVAAQVEEREPLRMCLDVLVQHVLTVAAGAGFTQQQLLTEVRSTAAFAGLTDQQWGWVMQYARTGGPALSAYDHFARIEPDDSTPPTWRLRRPHLVRNHRLTIGTISADQSMRVVLGRGRTLGTIEESFIGRLSPGDAFSFAGRMLELVRVKDMTAEVRPASRRRRGRAPSWAGSRMPLSAHLASAVRERLRQAQEGVFQGPEMQAVAPLLHVQRSWSVLPVPGVLLIEQIKTSEGHNLFVFPLQGRLVHEGLAALVAWRLARESPATFSIAANDYGFHLCAGSPVDRSEAQWRALLEPGDLAGDLLSCLNAAELAKRQFRDIARIAGLMAPSFPGRPRSARHAQASSGLLYDVLAEYEPDNLLIEQAARQVLESQLQFARLRAALEQVGAGRVRIERTRSLTPFAFPLWVDSLREQLTTEKLSQRIGRMLATLEAQATADRTLQSTRT